MASNWTAVEEEGSPLSDLAYTVTGIYLTILGNCMLFYWLIPLLEYT